MDKSGLVKALLSASNELDSDVEGDKASLQAAITAAETVLTSTAITSQKDIDAAVIALNTAIENFREISIMTITVDNTAVAKTNRPDDDLQIGRRVLEERHVGERRPVAEHEQQPEHDQHAQPEARHREEQDADEPREVVGDAVGSQRAEHRHRDADDPGQHERYERDLRGERARRNTISATLSWRKNEWPRWPRRMSCTQCRYCTGSGSLRPRSAM